MLSCSAVFGNKTEDFDFNIDGSKLTLPIEQGEQLLLKLETYDTLKKDAYYYSNLAINNGNLYLESKKETRVLIVKSGFIGFVIGFVCAIATGAVLVLKN